MKYSAIPEGSGLPRLPIPARAPVSRARRLVLAAILYRISPRKNGFISQREIQGMLNRAGRSPIQNHIHALRTNQFLSRSFTKRAPTLADEYRPGKRLRKEHLAEWKELTKQLFGRAGICKGLFTRPAFGTRFLGLNGMLVIGTLKSSRRPLTVAEVHRYLAFLIGDEGTVRNRLKRAQTYGLVKQNGRFWSLAPRFEHQLKKYEENFGAASRRERIKAQHKGERQKNKRRLIGCKLTLSEEAQLRKHGRCVRCRKTNAECLKQEHANLTIEHFPPRAWTKHWGLPDHLFFHFLICPSENSKYGGYLTGSRPDSLDKFIRLSVRSESDIHKIVKANLEFSLAKFYRQLDSGQRAQAKATARKAVSLWRSTIHDAHFGLTTTLDGTPIDISGQKKEKQQRRQAKKQTVRSRRVLSTKQISQT